MRYGLLVTAFAALTLLTAGTRAQSPPPAQECTGQRGVAWDQQIKSCTALIEAGQGDAQARAVAYKNRGNAYYAKGDDDRAMADYDAAIRLDPKLAAAYNNRGDVYLDREDPDPAIAEYGESIRADPKYARAYAGRALAYSQKGDFDRALADANAAIRLDPKLAFAYKSRGDVYRVKGDFARAVTDYIDAVRLDPKSSSIHNALGLAYAGKDDFDHAVAEFSEAIRLDPQSEAYENRGRANFYAGNLPKALADFEQANVMDPKYAYTALWLDIGEARAKMPSTLPQASVKVDMTVWPAPVIRMFLGQMTPAAVLAAADDPNAAKKTAHVCEANFFSGEWALRQNAKDEAARRFQRAASDCPKNFVEPIAAKLELKALKSKLP